MELINAPPLLICVIIIETDNHWNRNQNWIQCTIEYVSLLYKGDTLFSLSSPSLVVHA